MIDTMTIQDKTFKENLLDKYLARQTLNDFEIMMLKKYVNKTSLSTYFQYEDSPEYLNESYIEWAKLKLRQLNQELKQDKNIMKFLEKPIEENNEKQRVDRKEQRKTMIDTMTIQDKTFKENLLDKYLARQTLNDFEIMMLKKYVDRKSVV